MATDIPWPALITGFVVLLVLLKGLELGVTYLRRALLGSASGGSSDDS